MCDCRVFPIDANKIVTSYIGNELDKRKDKVAAASH